MKERPILFSAPMVLAIIEGRKTQTRRVYKGKTQIIEVGEIAVTDSPCPYGVFGSKLWVRETFCPDWCDKIIYRADGGSAIEAGYKHEPKWKPSIFMPRLASRINLEVVNTRLERLQDISALDAIAEGIEHRTMNDPRVEYQWLWESINGPGSWDANPFVWVIKFKKIK